MSHNPFKIYILPVSGGGFPAQLALLAEMYDAMSIIKGKHISTKDYVPDLAMASSGGNVSIYTAMAGGWTPEGIMRVVHDYESAMFIRSWWPSFMTFLPTWLLGIFHGSIYRNGYGAYEFFKRRFTSDNIKQTEIWTGTYDIDKKKNQMFCNLGSRHSHIRQDHFSEEQPFLTGSLPLIYLDGDLEQIALASQASASIPVVVSNVQINERNYADGGTVFASPLEPLVPEIIRIVRGINKYSTTVNECVKTFALTKEGNIVEPCLKQSEREPRKLEMIYFSPYQLEDGRKSTTYYGDQIKQIQPFIQLLDSMCLADRNRFINILTTLMDGKKDKLYYTHYIQLTTGELADILKRMEKVKHYALFLYAQNTPYMNLSSFTSKDIIDTMNSVRKAYGAHIWYIDE
jgi:hypothetical protein